MCRNYEDLNCEKKVCELIEKVPGINVNQDCLESCHLLLSERKKQDHD